MKAFGFVYMTVNLVTDMKYIGKCIYHRQNDWHSYLGSGLYLKRAIKKYGKENFKRIILEEAYSEEDLNKLEEQYIKSFNAVVSNEFYNLKETSIGGDIFTHNPNKEEIRKKRIKQMSGRGNHQYGVPKTQKMIDSVKKANSKAIEVDGIEYVSTSDASKKLGINSTTILYRLDSDRFPNYKRLVEKTIQQGNRDISYLYKRVSVLGREFNSAKDAASELGLKYSTTTARIRNPNYKDYFVINE